MRNARHHHPIRRFRDREDGAALVEFAIALPLLLVIFAVMIEGSRLMLSYQSTISGVREATRYMSRILPRDACATDLALTEYEPQLLSIVRDRLSGRSVLPSAVTLASVTSSCGPADYLSDTAPVVDVEATLEITHPLGSLLSFFGAPAGPVTTTVTDRSRVFGS
jgi:Flp pilus assembly pilin Flp